MIDRPAGWSWELKASGVHLARGNARIRYVERVAPLRRISDVAHELAPPGWRPRSELAIERLWTDEHEPAVLATQDGDIGGQPACRALGFVCLDDFFALVDGVATRADITTLAPSVRALVLGDTHERGVRRRRFIYTPPRGWRGLRVPPYHAYWFAPEYPRAATFLVAFPAQPRRVDADTVAKHLDGGLHSVRSSAPLSTERGLSGFQYDAELASGARRTIAVLEDPQYQYPVLVEAPPDRIAEANATFYAMVRSIEPFARVAERSSPLWSID